MDLTRRGTLLAAGATVGLAGCTDGLPGRSGDGTGGNGNGNGNGDGSDDDVFDLGGSLPRPLWRLDDDATGFVTLLAAEDDRPWMVEDPEAVEGLQEWLDETDGDSEAIVYVETVGPNTCYSRVDVSEVGVEDGEIVGTAAAVDTSGDDEGCGSAETHPAAFVRVPAADPAGARFAVTDGWGESSEAVADGRYVDPAALPGAVRPGGDPPRLESLDCEDEDFERHWAPDGDVALGETHDDDGVPVFAMRVHTSQALSGDGDSGDGSDGDENGDAESDGPRVGRGDEVRVTMWNVSTDVRYTGNRHKINLQVSTMDGWTDVRGSPDGDALGYTDEAVAHRPGEGFEWTFEMTEAGVLEGHVHEGRLEVCPDLQAGRYRFLHQEVSGGPLCVEFHYSD